MRDVHGNEAHRQLAVGELADQGLTINEIATELSLPTPRVRLDMTLMGFDTGVCNNGHAYSARRQRKRGVKAKPKGCGTCEAESALARYHLNRRLPTLDDKVEEVEYLLSAGTPMRRIAADMGVQVDTVLRWFLRTGRRSPVCRNGHSALLRGQARFGCAECARAFAGKRDAA